MATVAKAQTATHTAPKTSDLTSMQRMASKMWAPWVIMGLMIVGVSFIIGLFIQWQEAY